MIRSEYNLCSNILDPKSATLHGDQSQQDPVSVTHHGAQLQQDPGSATCSIVVNLVITMSLTNWYLLAETWSDFSGGAGGASYHAPLLVLCL